MEENIVNKELDINQIRRKALEHYRTLKGRNDIDWLPSDQIEALMVALVKVINAANGF